MSPQSACCREETSSRDQRLRFLRPTSPFLIGIYLSASVLFNGLYFQVTDRWSLRDFKAFTEPSGVYPGFGTLFRSRILMPTIARSLAHVLKVDLHWIFWGLSTLCVFAILIAYRKYLLNFLCPVFSSIFAVALLFPMIWNYCLLNRIYYPFDMPSILFFVMGCHFIFQRKWWAYYPTLVLASLNRETSCFLIGVFLLTLYKNMPTKRLLWHILVQAIMWIGLRGAIYSLVGADLGFVRKTWIGFNARILRDMFAFQGNGFRDWGKLLLIFGGTWLVIPWVYRRQPAFLKRCLLVVLPFVAVAGAKAVMDEVRNYGELIPVVLTPVLYAIAGELRESRAEPGQGADSHSGVPAE
jgi:hypothetical protein